MNILILNGSPRKNGNTVCLLEHISQELKQKSHKVESINLGDLKINPCIACGYCEKKGKCVFEDDMTSLYRKCSAADSLILASPIYFYSVTAQTKLFIDRCQVFWSRKYILNQSPADKLNKRGYFVSVAAKKGDKTFQGAELTIKYFFDALDLDYSGSLLVRGFDKAGSVLNSPDTLKDAQQFAMRM